MLARTVLNLEVLSSLYKKKALRFHKIRQLSLHFGKVLLDASYIITFTSIVTSIFFQDEQNEKIDKIDHKLQAPLL